MTPTPYEVDAVINQLETDEAEKERTRRALAFVNAQRHKWPPKPKVPMNRARLWQIGILFCIGCVLLCWYVLFPAVAAFSEWLEGI